MTILDVSVYDISYTIRSMVSNISIRERSETTALLKSAVATVPVIYRYYRIRDKSTRNKNIGFK